MSAFTVSHEDVQFLRQCYGTKHPVGVSRNGRAFRARAVKHVCLGRHRTENAAAVEIVKWYQDRYGGDWRHILASRHVNPIRYIPRKHGGYSVTAWVYGEPVKIVERCGGQKVTYYPTLEMAKRAVSRWLAREFGMFAMIAPVFLYRLSSKFITRPR